MKNLGLRELERLIQDTVCIFCRVIRYLECGKSTLNMIEIVLSTKHYQNVSLQRNIMNNAYCIWILFLQVRCTVFACILVFCLIPGNIGATVDWWFSLLSGFCYCAVLFESCPSTLAFHVTLLLLCLHFIFVIFFGLLFYSIALVVFYAQ